MVEMFAPTEMPGTPIINFSLMLQLCSNGGPGRFTNIAKAFQGNNLVFGEHRETGNHVLALQPVARS